MSAYTRTYTHTPLQGRKRIWNTGLRLGSIRISKFNTQLRIWTTKKALSSFCPCLYWLWIHFNWPAYLSALKLGPPKNNLFHEVHQPLSNGHAPSTLTASHSWARPPPSPRSAICGLDSGLLSLSGYFRGGRPIIKQPGRVQGLYTALSARGVGVGGSSQPLFMKTCIQPGLAPRL